MSDTVSDPVERVMQYVAKKASQQGNPENSENPPPRSLSKHGPLAAAGSAAKKARVVAKGGSLACA